jgi:hypothetical protein
MNRGGFASIGRSTFCTVCGRPLSFHQQYAGHICDDWRCRWAQLEQQIQSHRLDAARALGETNPEAYRTLVVPHRLRSIEELPAQRRRAHLQFLAKLVVEALQDRKPSQAPGTEESQESGVRAPIALAAAVCTVCAGACCHRGGDQAFLDAAAVMRFMAANHDPAPSGVVRVYAAHLPELSFAGSCVYHTLDGCTLPRSLRASICNNYRCRGLKQAEYWARNDGTTCVYVVVRHDNRIKRAAFVRMHDIRHYPLPNTAPSSGRPQSVRALP